MSNEINIAVEKILAMEPATIPRFVILKKFKGITPDDRQMSQWRHLCKQTTK